MPIDPVLLATFLDAHAALDELLVALAVTTPAPVPFAVEQTVMHAATVLSHSIDQLRQPLTEDEWAACVRAGRFSQLTI